MTNKLGERYRKYNDQNAAFIFLLITLIHLLHQFNMAYFFYARECTLTYFYTDLKSSNVQTCSSRSPNITQPQMFFVCLLFLYFLRVFYI